QTAQVWDVDAGRIRHQFGPMGPANQGLPIPTKWGFAFSTALSQDGRWLAYGNVGGFLLLFDVATGKEVRRFDELSSGAGSFALSPDGRLLAWGGHQDGVIHLVELASGKERHRFAGHQGFVYSLSFSADGKTLVSGSEDTTALVWDLTGKLSAGAAWG